MSLANSSRIRIKNPEGGVQGVRNQGDFGGAEKYSLRDQGVFKTDQIKEPGSQVLGAEPAGPTGPTENKDGEKEN
jgi:hypothetical protein